MANLKKIENYLKQLQLPYDLIDLEQEAFTVADVVDAGIKRDEVVKTLVIRTGNEHSTHSAGSASSVLRLRSASSGFASLALWGNDRVDFKKVRARFGNKSELASADEVERVVGVSIGAVCPIEIGIPVYFDQKVLKLKNVHMGSGDLKCGLEMKLEDLLKACGKHEVLDFALE